MMMEVWLDWKTLKEFCKSHNINIATIEELIRWRVKNDPIVKIKYTDQLSY